MKLLNFFEYFQSKRDGTLLVEDLGNVVSPQPSAIPGSTLSSDSTNGSGDIGIPFGTYYQTGAVSSPTNTIYFKTTPVTTKKKKKTSRKKK